VTDLARGEPARRERSRVRLDAVTYEALEAARRDWPKTEFDADLTACTVYGSADRLRVAVRNLLDNAAKFGPPEGPVEVRLVDGELTVRDHGPGIAPDDLPFVFDRFYRALSSRSAPGSGLGLAVVHEIALGHDGEVAAEAARGGGTLMRLELPTCAQVPDGPPAPHPSWLVGVQGVDAVGPGRLEEAHQPGDQGVGGRGDAVPGRAGRDRPVEVVDLGPPGVHQVLQHRR
jgi:hypothetical protein